MIYEEESEMAAQVVNFYKNLYQESEEWRPIVEGLEFDQIDGSKRGWLERRFGKEEILLAREIKLQVLMVSLWLFSTIVGEWWKVMF